ncbi:hypothetical protein MVEN_01707400 [Mycena venus]|uniref:Uncharacterized protein n=1 Tax=Mycena venus TaxID=2733690 RepID=A0A8H7CND9_9AGAR|nr:hypothetical protein MVEN_01707400 [Mycena venus]
MTLSNYVSADFISRHFPSRSSSSLFLVTLDSPGRGTFTTQLAFTVDHHLFVDVALGLQWKAFVADWLSGRGESVPPAFDPFSHVLGLTSVPVFLAPLSLPGPAAAPLPSSPSSPSVRTGELCFLVLPITLLKLRCNFAFGTCSSSAAIRFHVSICADRFAFGTRSGSAAIRFRLSVSQQPPFGAASSSSVVDSGVLCTPVGGLTCVRPPVPSHLVSRRSAGQVGAASELLAVSELVPATPSLPVASSSKPRYRRARDAGGVNGRDILSSMFTSPDPTVNVFFCSPY